MINKAKKLNENLKDLEETKQYFALKKIIEDDKEINELLSVINKTQQEAKKHLKENDIASYKCSVLTLEMLKKEFLINPIINNYLQSKEQIHSILSMVVDILSE